MLLYYINKHEFKKIIIINSGFRSITNSDEKMYKIYKCDICSKSFSWKEGLKRHMAIHTGEKLYKCNICQNYFSRKDGLNTPILIHTGEKSNKCNICSKSFWRKLERYF